MASGDGDGSSVGGQADVDEVRVLTASPPRLPRVVVIDDEPGIRNLLTMFAEEIGFDAAAADSYAAFQELIEIQTDAVVVDLRMPDVDGLEVIRFLASRQTTAALILTSGYDARVLRSAERLAKARGLRVAGTLSKPFSIDTVQELLEKAASLSGAAAGAAQHEITSGDLRKAIQEEELVLHYQPKVDLSTHTLVGVEALARWNHPALGMISPAVFIPLAEESGLIDPLTDWVLREALEQARQWREVGMDIRMSVNCSMHTLQDLGFAGRVEKMAREAGLPLEKLVLEVTETALAGDATAPLEVLTRLALKGAALSIDDYGTGYATLDQLDRIPFSELKIDHTFIRRAGEDEQTRIIVESSLEMAHRLGLSVVAEGVETCELWDWVEGMGCDIAQGYYIARPMPGADIASWSEDWKSRKPGTPDGD